MKTVLLQGAVHSEIDELIKLLPEGRWTQHHHLDFYETSIGSLKLVITVTGIGIINAALSSMIGIQAYQPACVINQGTAGGHLRQLRVGDLIIGQSDVYLNNILTPLKDPGQGSDSLQWLPTAPQICQGDARLVQLAAQTPYEGKLIVGRLGAGDMFSREADRIDWLHGQYGHLCENMESSAVYRICNHLKIPVLGVRIISNNELTEQHDQRQLYKSSKPLLQQYIFRFLELLALQADRIFT